MIQIRNLDGRTLHTATVHRVVNLLVERKMGKWADNSRAFYHLSWYDGSPDPSIKLFLAPASAPQLV